MKKLVTIRLDPDLLDKVRATAEAENRTLTNFIETVLKRAVGPSRRDAEPRPEPGGGDADGQTLEH